MPNVESYAPLAPFTLEELVSATNAILRDETRQQIQSRTVRFYITRGLLHAPVGGPKFARYSIDHLQRLVAIRQWIGEGDSLEQAAERLERGEHGGQPGLGKRYEEPMLESKREFLITEKGFDSSQPINRNLRPRRIPITRYSTLEIDPRADLRTEYEYIRKAIETMQDEFY